MKIDQALDGTITTVNRRLALGQGLGQNRRQVVGHLPCQLRGPRNCPGQRSTLLGLYRLGQFGLIL